MASKQQANSPVSDCSHKSKANYKHVPHSQKPPHLVAKRNARERRRVQNVNQAFYLLRKCVPIENRNKRVSKVKTLQRAIEHIQNLQATLAAAAASDEQLSQQQQQQQHQPQLVTTTTTQQVQHTKSLSLNDDSLNTPLTTLTSVQQVTKQQQQQQQQQLHLHDAPQLKIQTTRSLSDLSSSSTSSSSSSSCASSVALSTSLSPNEHSTIVRQTFKREQMYCQSQQHQQQLNYYHQPRVTALQVEAAGLQRQRQRQQQQQQLTRADFCAYAHSPTATQSTHLQQQQHHTHQLQHLPSHSINDEPYQHHINTQHSHSLYNSTHNFNTTSNAYVHCSQSNKQLVRADYYPYNPAPPTSHHEQAVSNAYFATQQQQQLAAQQTNLNCGLQTATAYNANSVQIISSATTNATATLTTTSEQ